MDTIYQREFIERDQNRVRSKQRPPTKLGTSECENRVFENVNVELN